jgi:predicted AlkP superfamily pyrophosphatase or phosphodiesterase
MHRSSFSRCSQALSLLLISLLLTSCSGPRGHERSPHAPTRTGQGTEAGLPATTSKVPLVLLVSIDGFHPDYLQLPEAALLRRIARDGARVGALRPSFPSLTFPNHYTLVTGLHPDRHGIIHNAFQDPAFGQFSKQPPAVRDPRWWGGEPIWVGARRHGLRSATLFWPGSEAPIGGRLPEDWLPYDESMSEAARVAQVLQWLGRPEPQRPHLLTLYFGSVDLAGHYHGPRSPQLRQSIASVSAALQSLLDGLQALDLKDSLNLVLVSDHGMAELDGRDPILLDDLLDPKWIEAPMPGELVGIRPRPGRDAEVEAALLRPHPGMSCHRRDSLPARWHYGEHPRVPPILCQATPPNRIALRAHLALAGDSARNLGAHGYDPELREMQALFIGHGPAFRPGTYVDRADAVDIYELLCRLLGIEPAPNDGDPGAFDAVLRSAP